MKQKVNIFVIFALVTLALVSCESYDLSYPEDLTTKQVYNFEVRQGDWVKRTDKNGLNPYYSCNFRFKNLNPGVSLNSCAVLVYINFGGYEQPLPYTRHFEDTHGNLWTRTIDFDYSLSDINFYVTDSDFAAVRPNETMYFRVVFIW